MRVSSARALKHARREQLLLRRRSPLPAAEETALGQRGAVALVPVRAAQGVYELVGETATSPLTGESVRIDDVARRVEAAGGGR